MTGRSPGLRRRPWIARLPARGCRALLPAGLALAAAALAADPAPGVPSALPLSQMVAVVHLHTSLADGASSPLELARAARAAGVEALVVTDHYLERVSYAPWPVGNVLGVTLSRPSVVAFGIDRYLAALADAERQVPGLIVVPGLEVTPYARFTGSLLAGSLRLVGWHRHLLVIGIENAAALARLPVLGNRAGGAWSGWSLLFVLPATVLAWSVKRVLHPVERVTRVGSFRLRQRPRPVGAALLGIASAGLIVAGYPFRTERFSPVGPDPGIAPFEELIDRVRALGGVTAWAHPEARAGEETIHGVVTETGPYPDLIRLTIADCFGAIPEGVRTLLPPGGLWDLAIGDALAGRRPAPPFALAESDEHRAAREIDFGALQTVFLVRARTRAGLLEALRAGRFYGRWTPPGLPPLRLADFSVLAGPAIGRSAAESGAPGSVTVHVAVDGGDGSALTARLVRGGEVIWSEKAAPPLEASIEDAPARPTYYRLDVEGAYPYRLISNPIVMTRRPEGA